ncbi:helix-turn-helix transcriptional regulator [Streptomyces sp. JJ66]|uniref:helix-turn-helix domain-containing protein n=1 Tax=Streptomyces sp. JJ66 TaxID=2803843 RepID=UPI001C58F53C|nr:helix-turn-helix transcriptional regulator [Streptomyces sp. JJ66]MBW1601817.1 helix-turn-helix transcriptional regulator [Streptomyces sp. JJ66]
MPQGDKRSRRPVGYVLEGTWPGAVLDDHHGARVAQEVAARLRKVIDANGWSMVEVARRTGVDRLTVTRVLAGQVWPDLLTIATLEKALDVDLWPGREPGNPPR